MIIGNGDIASALNELPEKTEQEDWIFLASGVSNSQETRESEYKREEDLLLKQDKNKHVVYISSLCIFYADSRYAQHKRHMEQVVKNNFKHYTILRLGNITWGSNPHTIINFLKNAKKKGEKFEIQDTYRYIIDKKEFLHWVNMIPGWNCEMNITGKMMKVKEIVKKYVK